MADIISNTQNTATFFFQGNINAGGTFVGAMDTVAAGNWAAGSNNDKIKDFITRTVPAGKTATLNVQIQVLLT